MFFKTDQEVERFFAAVFATVSLPCLIVSLVAVLYYVGLYFDLPATEQVFAINNLADLLAR